MEIITFSIPGKKNNKKLYAVTGTKDPKEAVKAVLRKKKIGLTHADEYAVVVGQFRLKNNQFELYYFGDCPTKSTTCWIVWKELGDE